MSDTDKSNQISISDIIQDIDHKPTKDWLEENAEEIQETFNGVQKDVNDINGLIESYNTLVVDPDLKHPPLTTNLRQTILEVCFQTSLTIQVI
mgnify:CR=1 FL=1